MTKRYASCLSFGVPFCEDVIRAYVRGQIKEHEKKDRDNSIVFKTRPNYKPTTQSFYSTN
mgnify:CR=1 FL=1